MKYCERCKKQYSDKEKYCEVCGAELVEIVEPAVKQPQKKVVMIKHRSIPLAIFLSLITCGIYAIYWMVKITNDSNALTKDTQFVSGIVAFLLTIVTCGIFGYYWAYKMGQKSAIISGENNDTKAILYIALSFFMLDIVVFALAQDVINKKIMEENGI